MRRKNSRQNHALSASILALLFFFLVSPLWASEAELAIPVLTEGQNNILMGGFLICILGMIFGLYEYIKVKGFPAHKSMLDVAGVIFETCKTYLIQQGKFLIILFLFIGLCIVYHVGSGTCFIR